MYGFGLVKFWKRENEWTRAAERLVPSLAGVAAVLILVVLGMEVAEYVQERHVPISPAALVAVAIALAGLAAAALVAALVPGATLSVSASVAARFMCLPPKHSRHCCSCTFV